MQIKQKNSETGEFNIRMWFRPNALNKTNSSFYIDRWYKPHLKILVKSLYILNSIKYIKQKLFKLQWQTDKYTIQVEGNLMIDRAST
jgi:hypothetical protein